MRFSLLVIFFSIIFIADTSNGDPSKMIQIGSGSVHYLGIIKVYDATLSVNQAVPKERILGDEVSKCLKLEYAVSLTVEDFIKGAEMVLQRQHSKEIISEAREPIDALHAQYRDVEKGDYYNLCYDSASSTTTLSLNKEKLVNVVSANFARLYFGIWLGPEAPLDAQLRNDLLQRGGSS
jgi:hypothetical protein